MLRRNFLRGVFLAVALRPFKDALVSEVVEEPQQQILTWTNLDGSVTEHLFEYHSGELTYWGPPIERTGVQHREYRG